MHGPGPSAARRAGRSPASPRGDSPAGRRGRTRAAPRSRRPHTFRHGDRHGSRPPPERDARTSAPSRNDRGPPGDVRTSKKGRRPPRRRPRLAAGPGDGPPARRRHAPKCHDGIHRRVRRRGRLVLEGRVRGRRGGGRPVRAAVRPGDAPQRGRGTGRAAPHAGDAGGRRGAGALAHAALRGPGPAPAVLDAAAARLCRAAGRRRAAGRHRAGTQRGDRHAGGDGRMRARRQRREEPASQRDRAGKGGASRRPVSRASGSPPSTPRPSRTGCPTSGRPWSS